MGWEDFSSVKSTYKKSRRKLSGINGEHEGRKDKTMAENQRQRKFIMVRETERVRRKLEQNAVLIY